MKCEFDGEVTVSIDGSDYSCNATALADYRYDSGRMYYRDGTGCPPDEELDIISLSVSDICRIDDKDDLVPVDAPDTIAAVTDAVEDYLYEMDIKKWKTVTKTKRKLTHGTIQ